MIQQCNWASSPYYFRFGKEKTEKAEHIGKSVTDQRMKSGAHIMPQRDAQQANRSQYPIVGAWQGFEDHDLHAARETNFSRRKARPVRLKLRVAQSRTCSKHANSTPNISSVFSLFDSARWSSMTRLSPRMGTAFKVNSSRCFTADHPARTYPTAPFPVLLPIL